MDPRKLYMDDRHKEVCVYCGGRPNTREHVPPRVFLDNPLPSDSPTVDSCKRCNESYSLDEQYVACALECARSGATDPSRVRRKKIMHILRGNPVLKDRIESTRRTDKTGKSIYFVLEADRVHRIVKKIALGHVAYEHYPIFDRPAQIDIALLSVISEQEKAAFENIPFRAVNVLPELGTRSSMTAIVMTHHDHSALLIKNWIEVQSSQYRYAVEPDQMTVRMVLGEYIACKVVFEPY